MRKSEIVHRGSCLCGGVRYELGAPIESFIYCHCQQCRKAQGGAFASNAPVPESQFRLVAGRELLNEYESSLGKKRVFCRRCGSPIFSKHEKKPGVVRLRLGLLDEAVPEAKPAGHFWVSSKADWHEITDNLPQKS